MSNYAVTIQKQYANSPVLTGLLAFMDQWLNPEKFTVDFLSWVWDINTAQGFGLDIWGRILGLSRYLKVVPTPGNNMGWNTAPTTGQTNWKPWSVAPFWSGTQLANGTYALDDTNYRNLLMIKAAANIAASDAKSINFLLRQLFGSTGTAFVGDDLDMTCNYFFFFTPTPVQKAIIEGGFLPRPAGVLVRYIYMTRTYSPFGFREMNSGFLSNAVKPWSIPGSPFYNGNPTG
ncbi:hypothetical protein T2_00045 [Ralstonia phage Elie]|uniref:DUF2612 domain-containing protein n=2 Tax=Bakolyvirus simangalove TaxID=2846051 RepID=A0A7G5BBS4_9CAUD|nr:structural protein [Ralstonia phage Adzire]YP_010077732.1 structural protein [Ralstonia phage Simangalove]QMV32990.1 hypothetical protein T2_00045 [Ralstonia phage Elie]QMV33702.1 hypothetical protein S3_00058 [Ralstonia phage Sarlave]QMV32362.1 hypothetical protein S1_00045 [Ralstonia phage Adzire]QMV33747.1 hypothetical protein R1_00045 [Ralstonia phage Simangalove]